MLPNLVVIGAMKCGTTSLHYYLDAHPQISMSNPKELNFFTGGPGERGQGPYESPSMIHTWDLGLAWYESRFDRVADVRGETSPTYAFYPRYRGVPKRMHALLPDAKLIYMVRDPIKRIISHYLMVYSSGRLDETIESALKDFETNPANPFVCKSRYAMQLDQYLEVYPFGRILVVAQEDLLARRGDTLRKVFRYLGVDEEFASPRFDRVLHESSWRRRTNRVGEFLKHRVLPPLTGWIPRDERYRIDQLLLRPFSRKVEAPRLDPVLRAELADFLKGDVGRLRELTGEPFAGWSL